MKNKKVQVELPEMKDDLTLGQWQQITALEKQENIDPDFYNRRVLNIVYGIQMDEVDRIKGKDIQIMIDSITKVMTSEKNEFRKRFTLDGVDYGLIPNFDEMRFGEFVDLEEYSEPEDYHRLMSILYRKVTRTKGKKQYEIVKYSGSHDAFKEMPLGVTLGAVGFFLTIGVQLMNDTLNSLSPQDQDRVKKLILAKSGDGSPLLINWLRETSSGSTK